MAEEITKRKGLTREQLQEAGYPDWMINTGKTLSGGVQQMGRDLMGAFKDFIPTGQDIQSGLETTKTGRNLMQTGSRTLDLMGEGAKAFQDGNAWDTLTASTAQHPSFKPDVPGQSSSAADTGDGLLDTDQPEVLDAGSGLGQIEPTGDETVNIGDAGPMIKEPSDTMDFRQDPDIMAAIRNLSTTAQGLQDELNAIKDVQESDDDDKEFKLEDIQNQIVNKLLSAMPEPQEGTIMDKYDKREEQAKKANEAAKELIESRSKRYIEEEETEGERRLTSAQEARRGFATNRALFQQIEENTQSRVRDLEAKRDDAMLNQDIALAERLDSLIADEEEALTGARQTYFDNLKSLSGEMRDIAGFETPEQKRAATLENSLTLLGATKSMDYQTKQAENLQSIKQEYADIPGIQQANSVEEAIGYLGPVIGQDREMQQALNQAKLQQLNASIFDSLNSAGGEQLNETTTEMLSDAKFLPGVLEDLKTTIDSSGVFGPVSSRLAIPGFEPARKRQLIDSKLRTAAQLVGKFMEGGVLRKDDEEKYRKMLPQMTDPTEVAQGKLNAVGDMLQMKYNNYLTDFAQTGYDVSGFQPLVVDFGDTTQQEDTGNLFD